MEEQRREILENQQKTGTTSDKFKKSAHAIYDEEHRLPQLKELQLSIELGLDKLYTYSDDAIIHAKWEDGDYKKGREYATKEIVQYTENAFKNITGESPSSEEIEEKCKDEIKEYINGIEMARKRHVTRPIYDKACQLGVDMITYVKHSDQGSDKANFRFSYVKEGDEVTLSVDYMVVGDKKPDGTPSVTWDSVVSPVRESSGDLYKAFENLSLLANENAENFMEKTLKHNSSK